MPQLAVRITRVVEKNNIVEVEGLVPARCAVGYYNVKLKIQGFKIIESKCDCGQSFCSHAVKLHLAFLRSRIPR
ncbi:hypothetical protein [Stygiolobus caldivivus]|uniref:SWIM-type domain-containing protein n=1 Tax=Stygiolobus caldivivus TaxID=2824673 RepID=A0A8D5ZHZ3_9CREN|nr:hypothetical protein [Stygiolobus caldivivus]BCU69151.1 hypothetical protein KN1_04480 [Stygiolobus caldivivus]